MQPNSDQDNRGLQVPSRNGPSNVPPTSRQAAVDLMRQQIDKIYEEPQPNELIAAEVDANPYDETHSNAADAEAMMNDEAIKEHWQKYHSAWQQYYQMYYERYYQAQIQKHIGAHSSSQSSEEPPLEPQGISKKEAVRELRSELIDKVKKNTEKVKDSRHFMPALVALSVALIFLVLQYNQLLFANVMAFAIPASTESSSSYIDPSTDISVSKDPVLKIPKINVDTPVDYTLTTIKESVVQSHLKNGVVHYPIAGASALPGEIGNTVILGHSANDVFDDGAYKFIFLHLDRLQPGDTFYLNYEGTRYTYAVTEKKIIDPTQVSELVINNGKPMATLITCTPPGTALKRLLVIGEQIAPDPATATSVNRPNTDTENSEQTSIGGAAKSFIERLFGGGY